MCGEEIHQLSQEKCPKIALFQ
eukprot:SAG11_NODE_50801_length_112_cov_94.769231_1_plen_21_part_01